MRTESLAFTLALVLLLFAGCSVVVRYDHYMPRAEKGEILRGQNHPAGDTVQFKEDDYYIQIDASRLSTDTVSWGPPLLPVVPGSTVEDAGQRDFSKKPLKVFIRVFVKQGSATLDLRRTELYSTSLSGRPFPVAVMRTNWEGVASGPLKLKLEPVESMQTINAPPPSTRLVLKYIAYTILNTMSQ